MLPANSWTTSQETLTLSDLTERLLGRVGAFGDGRAKDLLVRAMRDAIRLLPQKYSWTYFQREYRFTTSASVGHTVTYTESTKIAVTTDVWPADAADGELHIDSVPYQVAERVSDTEIKLGTSTPGADYSGSATWARESYPIPNIQRVNTLWQMRDERPVEYVTPTMLMERRLAYESPGTPVVFSFAYNSRRGETDLVLSPPPSDANPYMMAADIAPDRANVHQDFSLATADSGVTSITCPDARASWVGAVIRIARDGLNDTESREELVSGEYDWQAIVTGVSGTTVTVSTVTPRALANAVTLVSSLVDIDADVMLNYLEASALVEYRKNGKQEALADALAMAKNAFLAAVAADSKANKSRRAGTDMVAWPVTDTRYARVIT